MSDMLEVVIDSIRVSLMSQQRMVILKQTTTERYLAIFIGINEADAITLALQEVEIARPLTWDLLKNVFTTLNAHILRVEVVALREDTFYGNIVAEVDGRIINIDSRPSDALALAVRTHVPILVARAVMDAAGIIPDDDMQAAPQQKMVKPLEVESDTSSERLSVFEDFLEKLDLGDSDKEGDEDETKS